MSITDNLVAKLSVAFVAIAMAFSLVAPAAQAADTSDMSLEELISLVNSLQAQLAGSSSASACSYTFTRSLSQGSTGTDVMNLQKFLNMSADTQVAATGVGSAGSESSYYGALTAAAVSKFQTKYSADILVPVGLSTPTGYFGPSTMAKANSVCSATTGGSSNGGSTGSGDLEGGAGNIDKADFLSSLNNEEVGEGEEDAEVFGLEIEADDSSDIELTAIGIDFDRGSNATRDFDKYADEVSVWLDGEELARVDADEFEDDDEYGKTISLDNGGIIRAGDTGELVIAVSGVSNLDSTDEGDNWDGAITSVRFRDAQDAVITDSTTGDIGDDNDSTTVGGDERQFSFESFATASDLDFNISKGDDDINDARSIEVSSTTDTDNVEILSFEIEVEGDSDVTVDDLPVTFATSTGDSLSDLISSAELVVDGEVIGSESISSDHDDDGVVIFDNLDWDIEAGETVEVIVRVDMNELNNGTFGSGATLKATVTASDSTWDVEDEEGDDVETTDRSGSAASDNHTFYADGIQVVMNSVSSSATSGDNDDDDYVTLTIKFDVTAYGEDAYIPNFASSTKGTASTGATPTTGDGVLVHLQSSDTGLTAVTPTISSTADEESSSFLVEEGDTETFTVKAIVVNSATSTLDNAAIRMILAGVNFGDSDSATGDSVFTSNVSDIKTEYETIIN